jgi:hypothetical protein
MAGTSPAMTKTRKRRSLSLTRLGVLDVELAHLPEITKSFSFVMPGLVPGIHVLLA